MGNSPSSLEHAVDKGVHVFKKLKHLHDELSGDHSSHPPYGGGSTGHAGDNLQYTELRNLAHQEAEARNKCYEQSQEAYRNGDGALAKELSNKGHHHDNLMKQYNKRAADLIFHENNHNRPPTEIDLHGLFVKEASEKVAEAIERCQRSGQDHLVIIVGKGLHSPGNIAKLKPAITEFVHKYRIRCEPDRPNPGCLYVEFGKGTGDLSWLDRISNHIEQNGQCILM